MENWEERSKKGEDVVCVFDVKLHIEMKGCRATDPKFSLGLRGCDGPLVIQDDNLPNTRGFINNFLPESTNRAQIKRSKGIYGSRESEDLYEKFRGQVTGRRSDRNKRRGGR